MMPNEFQERVGQFPMWQWLAIEAVYRDDDTIPDVGGKDVIADRYENEGFDSIFRKYVSLGNDPKAIIKEQREDAFSRYDVTYEGYIINETAKTRGEVYQWMVSELRTNHADIWELFDYISLDRDYVTDTEKKAWPINDRIAVFYVRGGSEGFYFHIEALRDGRHELLILGKTLSESRNDAERVQNTLARIFEV